MRKLRISATIRGESILTIVNYENSSSILGRCVHSTGDVLFRKFFTTIKQLNEGIKKKIGR